MGWNKLKPWHWAGIIVGVLHLIVYLAVLRAVIHTIGESGAGYLLVFLELPLFTFWQWYPLTAMAVIGTVFFSLLGVILGWLVSQIIAVGSHVPATSDEKQVTQNKMKLWKKAGLTFGMIHLGVYIGIVIIYGQRSYEMIRKIEFGDFYSEGFGIAIMLGVVSSVLYGSIVMLIGRFIPVISRGFYHRKIK
jgi:hypothetical protein